MNMEKKYRSIGGQAHTTYTINANVFAIWERARSHYNITLI